MNADAAGPGRDVHPRSALALTRVGHRRLRPHRHALTHHTVHLLADIDTIGQESREIAGFAVDRRAPVALHTTDHLAGQPGSLRDRLAEIVEGAGARLPEGRILLLAHPRMLGHVFNPVAWWFAHDVAGTLTMVVAEVTSTFGDRSLYILDELERSDDGWIRASATKHLHVSPFLPVEGLEYRFAFLPPDRARDDRALIHMEVLDDEGTVLTATQDARFLPLDSANLRRAMIRHPMASLAAVIAIHRNAVRLWRLGVPFHRRPQAPSDALRVRGRAVPSDSDRDRSLRRSRS